MIWVYAAWGVFGGLAVEALEFLRAVRRAAGMPWKNRDGTRNLAEPGPGVLLISVLIRMGIGGGLAAAAAASGQVSGPLAAIAIGVAAPLIIEQFGAHAPALDHTATGPQPVGRPLFAAASRGVLAVSSGVRHESAGQEPHVLMVDLSSSPILLAELHRLDGERAADRLTDDDHRRLRAEVIARAVTGQPERSQEVQAGSPPPTAGSPLPPAGPPLPPAGPPAYPAPDGGYAGAGYGYGYGYGYGNVGPAPPRQLETSSPYGPEAVAAAKPGRQWPSELITALTRRSTAFRG